MHSVKTLLFIVLVTCIASSHAAKPTKIKPGKYGVNADGVKYREYTVECSNKKTHTINSLSSEIRKRLDWCLSQNFTEDQCWRKQIKAAKRSCRK